MTETLESKYLTLSLREELFAIPISFVLEVLEYSGATRIPGSASFMRGLIALRGRGIPVMDLRERLGIPGTESRGEASVIVVEAADESGQTTVGILADSVHEVVEIEPEGIAAPPRFGTGASSAFLRGVSRAGKGFILILDIGRVLLEEEPRPYAEPRAAGA
jgi:purine-binding chemotaxis protein CheW